MNPLHAALLARLRALDDQNIKKMKIFSGLTDAEMIRLLFSNYRGRGVHGRGLRLTHTGLQIMLGYFVAYTAQIDRNIQAGELLYLDRKATLPYFCSNEKIVVFETALGMAIKLHGGDIAAMIAIESY